MENTVAYTVKALADYVGADYDGDGDYSIDGLATLPEATPSKLSFYVSCRYKDKLQASDAGCVLIREEHKMLFSGNKLVVSDPYLSYAKLSYLFREQTLTGPSIHPSATIADDASLGDDVSIGPNVVIEAGAKIGANCSIGANSVIGKKVCIGAHSILYSNVNIYNGVHIGENCILHSASVIGSDGFGFAPSSEGWAKIYQLASVHIGDDVEIGAGTTIDRGALENTVIESGVKIDNQVQIAHNVRIGEHSAIAAAAAIAGSAIIGKRCTIAGGVGVVGHITIADDVHITAMSMITKSISQAGSYSSGVPMNNTRAWKKNAVRFNQLDDIARELSSLKKTMKK
ncbi:MAG: UDP-3-O-(3-hydroxymyristoyl)glucosamine N-acyltransferase [Cellvibrionaceae bacterium]